MILVNNEDTPFTIVAKVFVVVDKVLVVEEAILAIAPDPKLSGPVIVVVPLSVDDAEVKLLVIVLEAWRLVVKMSVNILVRARNVVAKKLVVVALEVIVLEALVVPVRVKLLNSLTVVVAITPLTFRVIKLVAAL